MIKLFFDHIHELRIKAAVFVMTRSHAVSVSAEKRLRELVMTRSAKAVERIERKRGLL